MTGVEIGILDHIQGIRGSLKPSLQAVADQVLDRPELARRMSVKELALAYSVSEASVSRFVRSIGIKSFRDFQLRLAEERVGEAKGRETQSDEGSLYESIGREDSTASILHKVAHRTSDVARACLSTLDPVALDRAAALIHNASALYVFAAGLSDLACDNAVIRFSRIGIPVVSTSDHNTQQLMASALTKRAVALGISDSGRTTHTVSALAEAQAAGAGTIAVTSFGESPLARIADVTLVTPTGYASPGNEPLHESMLSKFGQLIAIDALYSVVAVSDYDRSVSSVRRGDRFIQRSRSNRQMNGKG
ncbi:MurR/RpiR family transcriptional regulator [Amorphus orientalis]|uniref:DNA-binding MurR/RpiR family transcriptional regulator n=1 Tax=Amorphus orientalis TaxID=649198 RepID=A0AAE3VPV7_9HYPH|nr:MurR/RpiR family transcriptional regulator [Amorphus orientalis]MDQ0315907.1 DNA-binding MurR/RpiR family transcriptional regulator [Amorphus orientalis]